MSTLSSFLRSLKPRVSDPFAIRKRIFRPAVGVPTVCEDGVTRSHIRLSRAAERDPVIRALPEQHRMRRETLEPDQYTIYRKMAEKLGAEDNKVTRRWISVNEKRHAETIGLNRLYLSQEGEIPGYRRILWLGPGLSRDEDTGSGLLITVTDDGRLAQRAILPTAGHEDTRLESVSQLIELLRHGRDDFELRGYAGGVMNLNGRASSARAMPHAAVRHIEVPTGSHSKLDKAAMASMNIIERKMSERLNIARWAIIRSLDPEALRIMRGTQQTGTDMAEYLTGGDGPQGHDLTRDYLTEESVARKQALRSYPLLAGVIREIEPIAEAVDQRFPLRPVLADYYGTTESKLSRIQGLTWQKASVSPIHMNQHIPEILELEQN